MKIILPVLLIGIILSSCSSYEQRQEFIDEALSFSPERDETVIYVLREFDTTKPLKLRFDIMQRIDPENRDKLSDAMDTLDEDSVKGAGIPYDFFFFDKKSYIRLEMPPGTYVIFSYFFLASSSEIILSRKIMDLEAGKVYALNIEPEADGAYSSTIYHLEEISIKKARNLIKEKQLPLLKFDPIYKGEVVN